MLPMEKISEVPSWHITGPFFTNIFVVVRSKELHSHHSKDEDDNTKNKGLKMGGDENTRNYGGQQESPESVCGPVKIKKSPMMTVINI